MENNKFWKYPENNEFPKTSDGLVFCELSDGTYKKLLYFNLNGNHRFYDGIDRFCDVKAWSYLQ